MTLCRSAKTGRVPGTHVWPIHRRTPAQQVLGGLNEGARLVPNRLERLLPLQCIGTLRFAVPDEEAGCDIREDFQRFSQRDDIFCRSFRDA